MKRARPLLVLAFFALVFLAPAARATNATLISFAVPTGFNNLKIVWNSNTTFTTSADTLIVNNATPASVLLTSVSQQCNSATSGAGGLDTGSLAASTWYYGYVIYGTSGAACLFSVSSNSPTLPSGYTYFARTGTVFTDAGKNFVGFTQSGRHWQYQVGNNLSNYPIIWSGTVGGGTTLTQTSIQVPATASVAYIGGSTTTAINNGYDISPSASTGAFSSANPSTCGAVAGTQAQMECILALETAQKIWLVSQVNAMGWLIGFDDNL